ncbi:hypothetical protein [Bradyrhizobium genomosp. I (2014)]|uniref:hypothetical protein n=1 Tax=Bradyrhizobium genomosp. I (2014) TaxID=2683269 RepID=UPI000685E55E|nr:hypothetical protein [Bradyrhizobium sp. CCBAU 43298]
MNYRRYIVSDAWRSNNERLRELKVAGGHCRLCFEAATECSPLQVHHATYLRLGCEARGDLIALCAHCHRDVEDILRRRRFARAVPLRADVIRMRDVRTRLSDPTR